MIATEIQACPVCGNVANLGEGLIHTRSCDVNHPDYGIIQIKIEIPTRGVD